MTPVAALVVGAAIAALAWTLLVRHPPGGAARWARVNYRGAGVSLVLGPAAVAGLLGAIGVLAATGDGVAAAGLVAAAGGGVAGLLDDLAGDTATKGLAGHLHALRHGRVTTGAVKIGLVGAAGLVAGLLLPGGPVRGLAAGVLVAGTANLLNLFDLRPGRALKLGVLLLLPVAAAEPVALAGLGVAAALLRPDLRERGMLGDAGANAFGGVVGVAIAATARPATALGAAIAAVVALTLASERVSFSRVIDGSAPLRRLDRLGRIA